MSQRNKSHILIGGLILAGVLVIMLTTMLSKLDPTRSGPMVEKGEQAVRSRPAPLESVGSNDGDGARMATISDPALTIIVVGPAGLPLHTATIVASRDGEQYETTGRAAWDEISVGDWQIDVTLDGYLDAHKKISVIDGGHANVVITMYRSVDIRGRIVDTMGAVVPSTMIQFQREGDEAQDSKSNRGLRRVVTDEDGAFSMNLEEAGEYRLIVGAKASPLLAMEEPVDLAPGILELEVVIQGAGSVELKLTNLPELAKAKDGLLRARIYVRRARNRTAGEKPSGLTDPSAPRKTRPGRPTRDNAPIDDPGDSQSGRKPHRLNTARPDRVTEGTEQNADKQPDPSGMQPLGPEWTHKVSTTVSPDGTASFARLTARREYRLVLEMRRVQFQSIQSFRVDPERLVTLQANVPTMPADAGANARHNAILPLNLIVNYQSSGADIPEPGFYWK
ncbi:MAG: hypothetical protein ACI8QZ_003029 [Chlamydiales bacterium]|jgi:hypothetical protein